MRQLLPLTPCHRGSSADDDPTEATVLICPHQSIKSLELKFLSVHMSLCIQAPDSIPDAVSYYSVVEQVTDKLR